MVKKSIREERLKPAYDEDYDTLWDTIDYTDKVVMDIGADYGSTADYILRHGAKMVICVEKDMIFYRRLEDNVELLDNKIIPIHLNIDRAQRYIDLILRYQPDVIKADCEGCERYLLDIPRDVFCLVPEYVMEIHGHPLIRSFNLLFQRYDYILTDHNPWGGGIIVNTYRRRDLVENTSN